MQWKTLQGAFTRDTECRQAISNCIGGKGRNRREGCEGCVPWWPVGAGAGEGDVPGAGLPGPAQRPCPSLRCSTAASAHAPPLPCCSACLHPCKQLSEQHCSCLLMTYSRNHHDLRPLTGHLLEQLTFACSPVTIQRAWDQQQQGNTRCIEHGCSYSDDAACSSFDPEAC